MTTSEQQIELDLVSKLDFLASCLSSLDNLIAAEIQKLDALKARQKSLVQQLFPVMDETNT